MSRKIGGVKYMPGICYPIINSIEKTILTLVDRKIATIYDSKVTVITGKAISDNVIKLSKFGRSDRVVVSKKVQTPSTVLSEDTQPGQTDEDISIDDEAENTGDEVEASF